MGRPCFCEGLVHRAGDSVDTNVPYWVYVLYSHSGACFYTGLSEDVDRRLESHNAGMSRWTSRYRPWRCVYRRRFSCLTEARKWENTLKRQKGGRGFYELTGLDPLQFEGPQGS